MAAHWYVHDLLQPHVLSLMQWPPGAIFQQDDARPHTILRLGGSAWFFIHSYTYRGHEENVRVGQPSRANALLGYKENLAGSQRLPITRTREDRHVTGI
ncbi:hypothetical protein TNCV_4546231 [Trichonephila clavipes]|nr:hypothetical protein TNCV_4546231 [Trichonephila clavipes]